MYTSNWIKDDRKRKTLIKQFKRRFPYSGLSDAKIVWALQVDPSLRKLIEKDSLKVVK